MKGRITKLGAVALATAIGFATVATLVQAADPITERRELMKGNGAAMKAIDGVLKNGGAAADLEKHANQLNDTAMKISALFPAGTDQRKVGTGAPGRCPRSGKTLTSSRRKEVPGCPPYSRPRSRRHMGDQGRVR
jgi:hypothetical protein